MNDKVQKIKEWIGKTQDELMDAQGNFEYPEHEGAYHILCNLDAYIDTLQKEPVSDDLKEAIRNYADKEKFRKEVEKLKSNLIHGACSSQIAMETLCKEEAYNDVLAIINTMQEEPVSEDLEEAIGEYCSNPDNFATWIGGKETDDIPLIVKAIKFGANWQKEQMMKDSVLCGVDGWFINNDRHCRKNGRFYKYYVSTISHDKPLPMESGKDYRLITIKEG